MLRSRAGRGNLPAVMLGGNKALEAHDMRIGTSVEELVDGALAGRLGYCVRVRPNCRTLMVERGNRIRFCKVREGDRAAAESEWHWLHVLPMLGLAVPEPLAFERRGGRSVVCTAQAAGRPLDALFADALADGRAEECVAFACEAIAPRIRQLHDHGLVFRDLYWNHIFVPSLDLDMEPVFLDVERVFRPRWRRFRWLVKDLAGLVSSFPGELSVRDGMRFLRAYLADRAAESWLRRQLARAVVQKARAIAAHRPRYGS
jgi:hypothetical protein